ncbi:MAG TPA: DedA family protein [Candidatus Saccharimonadales bacterium]|jgi:membrane protein DedA with SNARE-associated domain|nr:DedA family protein [Candidatus Saccharimonadales bacterium]
MSHNERALGLVFRYRLPHNITILFGHTSTSLIQHLGYTGLGLGLVLGTVGLFSSEVMLLLAGAAIRQGTMNPVVAFVVALVAQLVGGSISHAIGRYGGVPLIERYGRYVLLSKRDLERAHRWLQRHGRVATPLGYCLPFIRGYVGYAAGIAGESRRLFVGGLLVGASIWSIFLMVLGYYLASNLASIEQVIRPFSYLLIAAVLLVAAWFVWHRLQERTA